MADAVSPVEALRFDAGSLSLNLVATRGRRYGDPVERLTSVGRLGSWLRGHGLDILVTDEDLHRARELREVLDGVFRAVLAGRPATGAVDGLNACSAALGLDVSRGEPELGGGFDAVVALIVADAMRILVTNERADLRFCEAPDCRMLYLGHSRRARRWCSSQRCGNRSRVAAHRARGMDRP